ncbi:unnamed protein product [Danaus chrysippus]|uniref:(African queen) hypothetical protein n=1 Tax=Danaus chrysippus TaxID=151541 RepID=A0A8J2R1D2_9NEOP|nr:unnamed protein product [Danaus chrysippus]
MGILFDISVKPFKAVSDCKIIVICNKRYLKVYGHLFNRQRSCGKGWAWYCHMYHRGCKSAVVTTTDLNIVECKENHNHQPPQIYRREIITTSGGRKLLMFGNFTYNRKKKSHENFKWYCSLYHRGCKASVITNSELEVVHDIDVVFTVSQRGHPVVKFGGHRFIKDYEINCKTRWRCFKRSYGCRAAITMIDNTIVRHKASHNH